MPRGTPSKKNTNCRNVKVSVIFLIAKQILRNIRSRIFRTIAVVLKLATLCYSWCRAILYVTYLITGHPWELYCISLSRTYFFLFPQLHRHSHILVLVNQKCLRPDHWILCFGLNGFSVMLFALAAPEVSAEKQRTIYAAFCSLILRLEL